jgi:hypothetical protein
VDLTCYKLGDYAVPITPANAERPAMDRNRHAYRCLPLSMANAAGYFALCPSGFTLTWDGGDKLSSLVITPDTPGPNFFAVSHFAFGILTFNLGWLFRTSPGVHLWAMGPPNVFKAKVQPYAAIIETDWLPYTFTMNWQMVEPGSVRFEAGEPFCFISPTQLGELNAVRPVMRPISDAPDLQQELAHWTRHRDEFNVLIAKKDPQALKQAWQRFYFRGEHPPEIAKPVENHINRLRLAAPQGEASAGVCPVAHHPFPRVAAPAQPVAPEPKPDLVAPKQPAPRAPSQGLRLMRSNLVAPPVSAKIDSEGRLHRSARTRTIATAAQAAEAGVDFLFVDALLTADESAFLCEAIAGEADLVDRHAHDPFWRDRVIHYDNMRTRAPSVAALMLRAMTRGAQQISGHWRLQAPLYADTLDLVSWREGMAMPPHIDNMYRDGRPHPVAHRDFSGVFYLNDGYAGGGLYLPHYDLVVQPPVGAFISLPARVTHEHAVLRVESGLRLTMPFFLTFDRSKAMPTFGPDGEIRPWRDPIASTDAPANSASRLIPSNA